MGNNSYPKSLLAVIGAALLWVLIALFFSIFTSCVTQKACDKKFPLNSKTNIKDSTVFKDSLRIEVQIKDSINYHDSLVIVKGSSGSTEFEDTNKDFKHTFKQDGNSFTVQRKNGIIKLDYELAGTVSRYLSQYKEVLRQNDIYEAKYRLEKERKDTVIVSVITHIPKWVWYSLLANAIFVFFIIRWLRK